MKKGVANGNGGGNQTTLTRGGKEKKVRKEIESGIPREEKKKGKGREGELSTSAQKEGKIFPPEREKPILHLEKTKKGKKKKKKISFPVGGRTQRGLKTEKGAVIPP